jgi:hypothetical protein
MDLVSRMKSRTKYVRCLYGLYIRGALDLERLLVGRQSKYSYLEL